MPASVPWRAFLRLADRAWFARTLRSIHDNLDAARFGTVCGYPSPGSAIFACGGIAVSPRQHPVWRVPLAANCRISFPKRVAFHAYPSFALCIRLFPREHDGCCAFAYNHERADFSESNVKFASGKRLKYCSRREKHQE